MNLTYTGWPLGYTPSADPVNGNPQGLQRMDNCYLDEIGVLSLVRGIQEISGTLANYPYRIYSKVLPTNNEAIWATLGLTSSEIIRSAKGDFSDTQVIGNGTDKGCFGDALGEVICFAGTTRIKDNGTKVNPLGLLTPSAPSVTNISQPTLTFSGVWTCPVGTAEESSSTGMYMFLTDTNVQGIILATLSGSVNSLFIGAGAAEEPDNDTFSFTFIPDDGTNITTIRVEILLNSVGDQYYWNEWDPTQLSQGPQQPSTLSVLRSQFKRAGAMPGLDWSRVLGIRFTIQANYQMNVTCQNPMFTGGAEGQITGTNYTYITVNVNDNGFYQALSPPSPATSPISVTNGNVQIIPTTAGGAGSPNTDAQVNQVWIYRGGGNLDQYYRVGISKLGETFTDNTSDDDLLEIDLPLNPFLLTLQPGDPNSINDTIYAVEGLFFNRMLYMGLGFIYISDALDLDAVDSRYTLKAFGDPSEKNLWIKKLTNSVCLLGTTKNLYEITGTFQPLPDGTIDATINPIGEAHPPLTDNVCSSQGVVFYVAAVGIRMTNGSNSTPITSQSNLGVSTPNDQLRLLFSEGETRADVPPFVISQFADYPIAVGKSRLYCSIPSTDGTQRLFVYDLINQYWRLQYTNPISLFVTQTDRVLLGYENYNGMGGIVAQADIGLGFTDKNGNNLSGFPLEIRTVFDANGQPRNRKDTFTLKLIVDTGGVPCSVYIGKDQEGDPYSFVGNFTTNGLTTVYFPLNNFTLGFRYSLRIVDSATESNASTPSLLIFKLYEATIEYDPRPEQLDYLRIQPSNLGTISRKRMVNYAIVIDTLGNTITLTPFIDNSNTGILPLNRQFSTPAKQTYIYYFTQEQIGTDINAILSGGVFEFYSLNEQEIISEKMPVPCEFLVIPNNDYGSPNRKRHSSYKFQINTRGVPVIFTPKLDGVFLAPTTYTTTEKRIVEYFFDSDTIAREIGGTLATTVDGSPFEFYGVITPQKIEELPPRLTYYRIPNDNLGVAARKRVRTIPLIIDTYGQSVTFNPIVDGVDPGIEPAVFTTTGKTTVLYYFPNDSFGIDYGGELISDSDQPFEFYGLGDIEKVEVLPVGKTYDQLGPVRFDKIGKIFAIRIRLIDTGNGGIPLTLYGDADPTDPTYDSGMYNFEIPTYTYVDYVYEYQFPKSINTDILRISLGNVGLPFHRYDCQIKVSMSGMESDSQWIPIR